VSKCDLSLPIEVQFSLFGKLTQESSQKYTCSDVKNSDGYILVVSFTKNSVTA